MKEFATAKMDKWTLAVTIFFLALTVGFAVIPFFIGPKELFFVSAVLVLSLIAALMLVPKLFLDRENIIIKTGFKTIRIPKTSLTDIYPGDASMLHIRTIGVGGVFGHFGYYDGRDIWYVTNIRKKVVIKTANRTYVISLENPQAFINEVKNTSI